MSTVPIDRVGNGFIGVLLAAGRGERFRASAGDAHADKLLALLPDGCPVAVASAYAMLQALPMVIAVVRPGTPTLHKALYEAGCVVLETADAARGMGASLAHVARELLLAHDGAGTWRARATARSLADDGGAAGSSIGKDGGANMPAPRGCLVALADMPWIASETLLAVQEAARVHRIAAPVHDGRRGHPVAFAWDLLPELAALDGDEGARALLKRHGVHEVPCADPGVLRDVDTVRDLT